MEFGVFQKQQNGVWDVRSTFYCRFVSWPKANQAWEFTINLGIYRKSTFFQISERWSPKSLNGLLQWMVKLRSGWNGSWNSSWAGVLLHFLAACCTKPYKSGPTGREFKMILQVMILWWSTPTCERTRVKRHMYAQLNHFLSISCSDGDKRCHILPVSTCFILECQPGLGRKE